MEQIEKKAECCVGRSNYIDTGADLIVRTTGTSRDYATGIMLVLLASACHGFYYPTARKLKKASRLNLFCLAIGDSGAAIKTRPLREILTPLLEDLERLTGTEIRATDSFSMESLRSSLAQKEDGEYKHKTCVWVRDEFSMVIQATGQQYLAGLFAFLSSL